MCRSGELTSNFCVSRMKLFTSFHDGLISMKCTDVLKVEEMSVISVLSSYISQLINGDNNHLSACTFAIYVHFSCMYNLDCNCRRNWIESKYVLSHQKRSLFWRIDVNFNWINKWKIAIFDWTITTTSSDDAKCDSISTSLNADHFTSLFPMLRRISQFCVVHDNPILRIKIVCLTKFSYIFFMFFVYWFHSSAFSQKLFPRCTLHETCRKKKFNSHRQWTQIYSRRIRLSIQRANLIFSISQIVSIV